MEDLTPPPAGTRRSIWPWIALTMLLFCVAVGGIGALGMAVLQSGTRDLNNAKGAANQFVDAVQVGDFTAAYAQTSAACKSNTSETDAREMLGSWWRKVGRIEYYRVDGFNLSTNTGGKFATLGYDIHGSRREGHITLSLNQEDGAWKVQGFNLSLGPENDDAHPH